MSTFEDKNSLRTIEVQIVQKPKNNEARPKFILVLIKKKACIFIHKKYNHSRQLNSETKLYSFQGTLSVRSRKYILVSQ